MEEHWMGAAWDCCNAYGDCDCANYGGDYCPAWYKCEYWGDCEAAHDSLIAGVKDKVANVT